MDGAGADGRDGGRRAVRRPPTANRTSTAPPSGGAVCRASQRAVAVTILVDGAVKF